MVPPFVLKVHQILFTHMGFTPDISAILPYTVHFF